MGIVNAIFRDVIDTTDCSRCDAPAGESCNDMKKNPQLNATPHADRLEEYVDRIGVEKFRARVAASGPARNGRRMQR